MPKTWSINTTIRNPERLIEFLKVLEKFEGQDFNKETQKLYQKELIKHKYYKPNNIQENLKKSYDEPELFTDDETNLIFSKVKNADLRGRTSASRNNQMGLSIAKENKGPIIITKLGKDLLNEKISLNELFLRYFLKWQLPNPIEKGYNDFNLNPFICTLDIISKVNDIEKKRNKKSKGISKQEFAIFIIPLKNYKEIDNTVNKIIQYRDDLEKTKNKNKFYKKTIENTAIKIFNVKKEDKKSIIKKSNNLEDYADSAIRWFRITQLLYYRGNKKYIDISPRREEEVNKLISNIPKYSNKYKNEDEYIKLLINKNKPELPWENPKSYITIIKNLAKSIEFYQNKIDNEFNGKRIHSFEINPQIKNNDLNELKKIEKTFRTNLDRIINEYQTLKESNFTNLEKYIKKLENLNNNIRPRNKIDKAPLCLEWYVSLTLMALNDSIEIKPNFSKGDDNIPTFTAPGGVPDIEAYYKNFNLIIEVTLMNGRNQFLNEVQPILRHYKDFNKKNNYKKSYLLFIAPSLYRDTKNHLRFYIENKYENTEINIIPLTIELYNKMLKIVLKKFNEDKPITHEKLEKFFKSCVKITKNIETYDWEKEINKELTNWELNY